MEPFILLTILYFTLGAIIGSFLGMCAYRIPMGRYEPIHEGVRELSHPVSLFTPPRSFCPRCENQLLWWHLIPLVSWLLLKGRCAFCREKIPFRYWFIELLTGTLCALCFLRFGPGATGIAAFFFISLLVVITFIDLDYMIIPDVITYPATVIGLAIGVVNRYFCDPTAPLLGRPFVTSPLESIYGLLAGPGSLLLVWWFYHKVRKKEGLGLGDVKLLAFTGAAFGPECAWFTIFIGSTLGAVIGIIVLALKRSSLSSYIPFGPYLAFAAAAYLFDLHFLILHLIDPSIPTTWWVAPYL